MELRGSLSTWQKNLFALCGVNAASQLIWRKGASARQLLGFMGKLAPCLVGMEACGGAHYWARELAALGHEVRLVSPALVTPYRKGNKTDRNDAIRSGQKRRAAGSVGVAPSPVAVTEKPHRANSSPRSSESLPVSSRRA